MAKKQKTPKIKLIYPACGFDIGDEPKVDEVIPLGDYLEAPVQYRVGDKYIHQRYVAVIG